MGIGAARVWQCPWRAGGATGAYTGGDGGTAASTASSFLPVHRQRQQWLRDLARKSGKSCGNSNPLDCSASPPIGTYDLSVANRSLPFCCVGANNPTRRGRRRSNECLTKDSSPK